MSGFAVVYREAADHPLFAGDSARLGAWIYLLLKGCWKPTRFNIGGKIVELQRGQLCASRAQLAEAWGWAPSKVERFLACLEGEQMIGRATGQGRTIITICNYDKYQDISEDAGQAIGQLSGQNPDRTGGRSKTGQDTGQPEVSANHRNSTQNLPSSDETGQAGGQASDSDRTTKEQRNQETKDIPSPNGDGRGEPAPLCSDLAASIFRTGLLILGEAGHPEQSARQMIGKWRKAYSTGSLLAVLASCQNQNPPPSDPIGWVTKALQAEQLRAAGQSAYTQGPRDDRASVSEVGAEIVRERAERRERALQKPQERIALGGR